MQKHLFKHCTVICEHTIIACQRAAPVSTVNCTSSHPLQWQLKYCVTDITATKPLSASHMHKLWLFANLMCSSGYWHAQVDVCRLIVHVGWVQTYVNGATMLVRTICWCSAKHALTQLHVDLRPNRSTHMIALSRPIWPETNTARDLSWSTSICAAQHACRPRSTTDELASPIKVQLSLLF